MVRICVTGGAGFIGSNFVRRLIETTESDVVVLDLLTYAGNLENLEGLEETGRMTFVKGSVCDADVVARAVEGCGAIVNFAAETHVDRSISDPSVFLETNVEGPQVLMKAAKDRGVRFVQVSTDEVYGSLTDTGLFTESSPLDPSSPYAASKASADLLLSAFVRTFGLDAVVTRCGNNYGPRQFPEKLIPLFVTNALEDKPLPLYGDGLNVRDWIHVDDHCDAIMAVMEAGETGQVYNISASQELTNKEIAERLLDCLGKPWDLVHHVEDRPGHDRRYALDASKLCARTGWRPKVDFDRGLAQTVAWYRDNVAWWQRIKSGEYRRFYDKLYGDRLKTPKG